MPIQKNIECGNYCSQGVPEAGCRMHDPDEKPIGFDTRHCWAVRGTDPYGSSIIIRWVPGNFLMRTLSDCERQAKKDERHVNGFGGSVRSVKQHLDINDLWQDS